MQSYPFGTPPYITKVTSASNALSASFTNDTITINTASIGLNSTGPQGAPGTNTTISGPTGTQGATGPQGPTGLGIWLLSSSLATCST